MIDKSILTDLLARLEKLPYTSLALPLRCHANTFGEPRRVVAQ
jgi:hypothetical protein